MDSADGVGDIRGEQGGEKRDIRRPMNAFLIFCKRHRSMVREKHPDRDNRSVTRILGDLWANLAEDEKLVYTNLAKQYKDAFMKAHPDYKWHSSEKVTQPVKMATRPTNARPPRSLSTSDYPSEGGIMPGQLADPDKMGGLNLLLMAGQHSFPIRDKPITSASIMERRMTSPDVSGANAALLQLAEMCTSELRSTQADDTALCSAPPKKRARHRSYSEFGHANSADWANRNAAYKWNLPPLPTPAAPCQPTQSQTASQVSAMHVRQAESTFQRQEVEGEKRQQPNVNAAYALPIDSGTPYTMPANSSAPYTMSANNSAPFTMPATPFTAPANSSVPNTNSQPIMPANNSTSYKLPVQSDFSLQNQHDFNPVANHSVQKPDPGDIQTSAAVSSEVSIPPKKKFTKLQEACKSEPPGAPTPNSAAGGCLSDQNDNAIFTCGKLVVDHIIDRLFSASFTPDQNISAQNLSSDDMERARKILTADITEREKLRGSASRDMGRLLSEVVHKPQNLVEKVIEEAYSCIDLKQIKTLMPHTKHHSPLGSTAHHMKHATQAVVVASHLKPSSQLETIASFMMKQEAIDAEVGPLVHAATGTVNSTSGCMYKGVKPVVYEQAHIKEQPATQPQLKHWNDVKGATLKNAPDEKAPAPTSTVNTDFLKEESHESTQDEDENFMQPVRKSQRRNRGQRYQELINEGIIQPSKERLAARRHEQTAPYFHGYHDGDDCGLEEDGERHRHMLKRSISESDSVSGDEKRYRTADFDLEAEIATLPPCSLEQVTRRRPSRKQSDSESSRKLGCPSSPTTEDCIAPTMKTQQSAPSAKAEALTGSQKRKARKHSISRLVASTDVQSGGSLKSPGIVATVPLVRDATAESSAATTTTTTTTSSSKPNVEPEAFVFSSAALLTSSKTTPPVASAATTTTLPSATTTTTSGTTAMTTTGIAAAMTTSVMAAAITDVIMAAASSTTTFVTSVTQSFMASQASVCQNLTTPVSSVSQNSAAGLDRSLFWPETSSVILGAAQKMQLLAEEQRKSEGKSTAKSEWNRSTGAKSKDGLSAPGASGFRTEEVPKVAPIPTEFTNLKELDDNTWIPCFIPKGKPDAGSALYAKSSEHQAVGSAGSTKKQKSNRTEVRKPVEKHRDVSSVGSSSKDCRKRSSGGNGGKGGNSLSDARVLGPATDGKSGGHAKSTKQTSGVRKKTGEGKKFVAEECGLKVLTEKDHTHPAPLVAQSTTNACQNDAIRVHLEKQTVSFSAVGDFSEQKPSSKVKLHVGGSDVPKSDSTVCVSSAVNMYEDGSSGYQAQSSGQLACVLSTPPCTEKICKLTTADHCTSGLQDRKPIGTCDAINSGLCPANGWDLSDNQEISISSNNPDGIAAECANNVTGNSSPGSSANGVPVERSIVSHEAPDTRPRVVTSANLSPVDTFQNTNETIITAVTSLASVVPPSGCYGNTALHFSGLATVSTTALVSCVETSVSMTSTVGAPALEMMHDDSDDMETTVGSQMLCQSPLPGSPSVGVVHS